MNAAETEAIAGGYHGDAFSVLGPHLVEVPKGSKSWEIRAILPHARAVSVVQKDATTPMVRIHTAGLFVASFAHDPGVYRLSIEDQNGVSALVEDPYRFGPLMTEFDLHLHAEGN